MFKDKLNYKLLNVLIFSTIVYLALITMDYWWSFTSKIISILFPFILAFAIAYALYPAVRKLQEKGVRKSLAVASVVVLFSSLFLGLIIITIPVVYEQFVTLSSLVGEVLNSISQRFSIDLGGFESTIMDVINGVISKMGNYISDGTIDIVGKSIDFITKAIIIYIVSIYFLS